MRIGPTYSGKFRNELLPAEILPPQLDRLRETE